MHQEAAAAGAAVRVVGRVHLVAVVEAQGRAELAQPIQRAVGHHRHLPHPQLVGGAGAQPLLHPAHVAVGREAGDDQLSLRRAQRQRPQPRGAHQRRGDDDVAIWSDGQPVDDHLRRGAEAAHPRRRPSVRLVVARRPAGARISARVHADLDAACVRRSPRRRRTPQAQHRHQPAQPEPPSQCAHRSTLTTRPVAAPASGTPRSLQKRKRPSKSSAVTPGSPSASCRRRVPCTDTRNTPPPSGAPGSAT